MPNNKYCESTIKVGTFFSGIGAPEKAFQRLKEEGVIKDYKLEFFSEIDKNAIKSFCANTQAKEIYATVAFFSFEILLTKPTTT